MENNTNQVLDDLDISLPSTKISIDPIEKPEDEPNVETEDLVKHPSHYTYGKLECLDVMKAILTKEEFHGYLKATALKYLWRFERKGNPVQDLNKCKFYIDKLIEEQETVKQ